MQAKQMQDIQRVRVGFVSYLTLLLASFAPFGGMPSMWESS